METSQKHVETVRQKGRLQKKTLREDADFRAKETSLKHVESVRQQSRLQKNKQREDEEFREKERSSKHTDFVRDQAKQHVRKKRQEQDEHKKKCDVKQQRDHKRSVRHSVHHQKTEQKQESLRYRKNAKVQQMKKTASIISKQKKKDAKTDIHKVIDDFHTDCKKLPCYSCCVCSRFMFKSQVVKFNYTKYSNQRVVWKS